MKSPVLFLIFNRPETTRQVFESIRAARPPRLYVAADGPRPNREGEAELCAEVRRMATAIDWPCDIKTLFREENLGCRRAVSEGISWFFCNMLRTRCCMRTSERVMTANFWRKLSRRQ